MIKQISITDLNFTDGDVKYVITPKHYYPKSSSAQVCLSNMSSENFTKKIIIKKFHDRDCFTNEKNRLCRMSSIFAKNKVKFYHDIMYADPYNNVLIYNYLGETLDHLYNTYELSVTDKLKIFNSLVSIVHVLSDYKIVHNDIKPCNVVVDKNKRGLLIDYGISQVIYDDYGIYPFDTTIWSATPEYYMINKCMLENIPLNNDIITMYIKSQTYPLAGILIGLLLDEMYDYFETIYTYVRMFGTNSKDTVSKYEAFDFRNNDTLINALDKIKLKMYGHCIDEKFGRDIYLIIENMLELDYTKRLPYYEIVNKMQTIIDSIM